MKINKKNKSLLIGFFIALFLSYNFAVKKTIFYYKEYQIRKTTINNNNINNLSIINLNKKEKQLDLLLSKYNIIASESFQNDLLKQLNIYCMHYNLKIIDFKEPHVITNSSSINTSYVFSLKGSFNGCLILINQIENNPNFGNIKHLYFTKKRDYKTNMDELFLDVILQKNQSKT